MEGSGILWTFLNSYIHLFIFLGEEERERFISELESFIAQLLKMVEVELKFNYETLSKISGQVHGKTASTV